jgi:ankyrin repeat protein
MNPRQTLINAIRDNAEQLADTLLANGLNLNAPQDTLDIELLNKELLKAAEDDDLWRVKLFVNLGADANYRDDDNLTSPILYAVQNGHYGMTEFLLNHGADANSIDVNGNSILTLAAEAGNDPTAKLLIEYGANADNEDERSWYPIIDIINFRNTKMLCDPDPYEIIEMLLERGTDIHVRDEDDMTPLYAALDKNFLKTAELLLEHGADPNEVFDEHTLLDTYTTYNNQEIVELLCKYKAKHYYQL